MTSIHTVKVGTLGIFGEKKNWLQYVNFCHFYTSLNMEENKVHFRHLMFLFFQKGKSHKNNKQDMCCL